MVSPIDRVEVRARAALGARVAREAARLLRDRRGRGVVAEVKREVDFVTDADRASQRLIDDAIREAFPRDAFVAEEDEGVREGDSGFVWVVDPLDGTTNFVHGYEPWVVSVALLEGRADSRGRLSGLSGGEAVPRYGCVCVALTGALFEAEAGQGATLDGERIRVSSRSRLADSLLVTGFPYDRRERLPALLQGVGRALAVAHGVRRSGSAAFDLCSVARGAADGFWEQGLNPWDLAAGVLIVEEAGGRVTGYRGEAHALHGGRTVASNGLVHDALLEEVVRAPEAP